MNTKYWLNKVMDQTYKYGKTEYWLGLSSSAPNEYGANVTEPVSGVGYSRVEVTSLTDASNGEVHNASEILFPTSRGTWFNSNNPAAYWVIFDGQGNSAHLLSYGALETPVEIFENMVMVVSTGAISITLTDYRHDP